MTGKQFHSYQISSHSDSSSPTRIPSLVGLSSTSSISTSSSNTTWSSNHKTISSSSPSLRSAYFSSSVRILGGAHSPYTSSSRSSSTVQHPTARYMEGFDNHYYHDEESYYSSSLYPINHQELLQQSSSADNGDYYLVNPAHVISGDRKMTNSIESPNSRSSSIVSYSRNAGCGTSTSTKNIRAYRFRDEPEKKKIIKTEMCRAILSNQDCHFGDKCNYAHSEAELRCQTIEERHEAGLCDKETFRTRPCLDHIATGSCPMKERCKCLHDPRITSDIPSWLPQCALKSTKLESDVHVDYFADYHFALSQYGHPFGKSVNMDSWGNFYDTIIGKTNSTASSSSSPGTSPSFLTESQKLHIAIQMRHDFKAVNDIYKYKPTHKILSQLCMLIQTKAFDITKSNVAIEISISKYDKNNINHVKVREIAFGSLCKHDNHHPLALWFGIDDDYVQECSAKEKMRPKRTERKLKDLRRVMTQEGSCHSIHKHYKNSESTSQGNYRTYAQAILDPSTKATTVTPYTNNMMPKCTSFDKNDDGNQLAEQPFLIYCPKDKDSYELVSSILEHRLGVITNDGANSENDIGILEQETFFHALKKHYSMFHWPVNKGREIVDKSTLVPDVQTMYNIPSGKDKQDEHHCAFLRKLWYSFIDVVSEQKEQEEKSSTDQTKLDVFKLLSNGVSIQNEKSIKQHYVSPYSSNGVLDTKPQSSLSQLPGLFDHNRQINNHHSVKNIFDKMQERAWSTVLSHYSTKKISNTK